MTRQEFEDAMLDTAKIATQVYEAVADSEGEVVIDAELVRLLAAGFLTLYSGADEVMVTDDRPENGHAIHDSRFPSGSLQ